MGTAAGTGAALQLVKPVRELRLDWVIGGVVLAALKLEWVLLQVIELLLTALVLGVHVAAVTERLEGRFLDQELASLLDTRLLRDRDQRASVDDVAGARVGRLEDRRGKIGVDRQVIDAHSRWDTGAAHLKRHPDRLLIDVPLDQEQPVLAVQEAVVRREHEQRVCELAARRQRVDDLLDAQVDREERLERAAIV